MQINHIYKGNCIEILNNEIEENSIELIYSDPPFNLSGNGLKWLDNKTGGDWFMIDEEWDKMPENEYFEFSFQWINGCKKVLKENGSIYISCTYHNIAEILIILKRLGFKINNVIVWHKTNAIPNMTKRLFTHSSEFVVWAVKGKNWIFNYDEIKKINPERKKDGSLKQMRDVWLLPLVQGKERIHKDNGRALHPTQKPEELLKRIIIASSKIGNIVLDPFIGSGTTAVVAERLGRNWIGIEKNQSYITAALNRLNNI